MDLSCSAESASSASGAFAPFGCLFFLALYTGLFVVFPAAGFRQNTIRLHFPAETPYEALKALIFRSYYFSQRASSSFLSYLPIRLMDKHRLF